MIRANSTGHTGSNYMNAIRDGQTHTHKCTDMHTDIADKNNFKRTRHMPACSMPI